MKNIILKYKKRQKAKLWNQLEQAKRELEVLKEELDQKNPIEKTQKKSLRFLRHLRNPHYLLNLSLYHHQCNLPDQNLFPYTIC